MTEHAYGTPRRAGSAGCLAGVSSFLIAGLLITGCGGGSGSATVARLPGHGGQDHPPAPPITLAQSDAAMVRFARCMRAHGVQMSDPFHRPGHSGLSIDLPTRDATTQAAYGSCVPLIQPLVQAKLRGAATATAPLLGALTIYARCMRAHDISMLDPTPQGALSLGRAPGISSDFGRYSPQFRTADGACRHVLPASIHDDGTGP
ncbi:MAG: hypothetical protein JWP44_5193 [Mucilaginibacter sp.]|nr:hypothetical protein [Mucilaginibacter sp.]